MFPCPVISEEFELILLKFEVIVLLEFPTKNVLELIVLKFDVIVAFKLLIKCVFELILLAFVSSLIVFGDIVGSIEVMVKPCAVILLKLLVIVAFWFTCSLNMVVDVAFNSVISKILASILFFCAKIRASTSSIV